MARRFRGESVHKVDTKGRVSIPAPFRRVLVEGDPDCPPDGKTPSFVLVYGLNAEPCLLGYTMEGIARIEDKIARLPYSPERKRLERRLLTQSIDAKVDENGRIVLSQKMRDKAAITDEAVFAGMNDRFQIWNPAAFEADMSALDEAESGDPFEILNQVPWEG